MQTAGYALYLHITLVAAAREYDRKIDTFWWIVGISINRDAIFLFVYEFNKEDKLYNSNKHVPEWTKVKI